MPIYPYMCAYVYIEVHIKEQLFCLPGCLGSLYKYSSKEYLAFDDVRFCYTM